MTIKRKGMLLIILAVIMMSGMFVTQSTYGLTNDDEDVIYQSDQSKTKGNNQKLVDSRDTMRGVWVATVLNLDYPSKGTRDADVLKKEALEIIENCDDLGFNAIFLQVRPAGDAFYRTGLAPWSQYLTGTRGAAPRSGFDPLEFWIEECHKRGIELHAWFNPYRVSMSRNGAEGSVSSNYKESWLVRPEDGRVYLNPGIPAARRYIEKVVEEVADNYAIDGIHFDDYFYPSPKFDDEDAYKKYNSNGCSLSEWRIGNVNTLIQNTHRIAQKHGIVFGVSPFGIWANKATDWRGSDTKGSESLTLHYADSYTWVKEGWVDYICPQIYWHIGFDIADYEVLSKWWNDVVDGTGVKLYAGLATYRAMNSDSNSPWYGTMEIFRQMNANTLLENVDGEIHFRYKFIADSPSLFGMIKAHYRGITPENNVQKLIVGRPVSDLSVPNEWFYIGGVSDPNYTLYLNGELVPNRTKNGYFGMYVPLNIGQNVFKFVNGDNTYTRIITRYQDSWKPTYTSGLGDAAPKTATMYPEGKEITLSCTAPAGNDVYAVLDGVSYPLTQDVNVDPGVKVRYSTQISLSPKYRRLNEYGKVTYHLYKNGVWHSQLISDFPVEIIADGSPIVGTFNKNYADTAEDNSRVNGSSHIMPKGTKDYIVQQDGNMYQLKSGFWVYDSNIDVSEEYLVYNRLKQSKYSRTKEGEQIVFDFDYTPVLYADVVEDELHITINNVDINMSDLNKIKGELFDTVTKKDDVLVLHLKNPDLLGGYYTDSNREGEITLSLRKKKVSRNPYYPLKNITIMLDPGHGGTEAGSYSLYGSEYGEKEIVLALSYQLKEKLEAMGAKVIMTRADDSTVSLYDRLRYSREYLPDMFVSIHTDSMYESRDLSNIYGATVYYKHPIAERISKNIAKAISEGEVYNRGSKTCNFYVCRGTWAPSILIENGFSCNAGDLEHLMDSQSSSKLLDSYVKEIVDYFENDGQ